MFLPSQAVGFFGASGVAGYVPYMYIHFAKQFLLAVEKKRAYDRVKYSEYLREEWTFHVKGW